MNENIPKEVTVQPRPEKLVDKEQMKGRRKNFREKTVCRKTPMSRSLCERAHEGHYSQVRKMEGNLGADELQNREGLHGQDLVPP